MDYIVCVLILMIIRNQLSLYTRDFVCMMYDIWSLVLSRMYILWVYFDEYLKDCVLSAICANLQQVSILGIV